MSRGIDRDDLERAGNGAAQSRMTPSQGRGGSGATEEHGRPRMSRNRASDVPRPRERAIVERHRLSTQEREALLDLGRFRTIDLADLQEFRYAKDAKEIAYDLANLTRQGLIYTRSIPAGRSSVLRVAALTKAGRKLAQALPERDPRQTLYAMIVKPREASHDARIYRMFQIEAERIAGEGGHVQRVVLDYELKRDIYSPLAKAADLPALEYAQLQQAVAEQHGLTVVDGKIPLPDLRVEYEDADGQPRSVDLELATEHYRAAKLSAKSQAGFKVYSAITTSRGCRAEWEGRELTRGFLGG